jgi:hypothetical protein
VLDRDHYYHHSANSRNWLHDSGRVFGLVALMGDAGSVMANLNACGQRTDAIEQLDGLNASRLWILDGSGSFAEAAAAISLTRQRTLGHDIERSLALDSSAFLPVSAAHLTPTM